MDAEERVRSNMALVHSCAQRFRGRGIEYDDLFQAGCLGLIKAAENFEESRGLRFSTYAVFLILGEMKLLFRKGGTVTMSRALRELSVKAARERDKFLQREGRQPSIGELAEILGVEPEQAAQALEASQPALSLTDSGEDGGGQTDVAVDSGEDAALERLSLRQAVQELAPRDRNIVYLRYCKSSTQTETARRLGMTQVQVSRREKVILQQLRLKLAE
ncbi:sigma-70 family RNA polymerase sigma factor [Anaeromassilibacillus sp. An200]|uniref:sigma-70 family RNA polymerase sigma factor n=1 Tax=Anaeromassilibacillus sp. An200 TaxID=1965587 RepID=UPI000B38E7E9|nr:sigma-70 family RNA polymerase sigma factor [Anaeromassilibacillus sp. An200]OUP07965.1 flagellar biosynthesis protein FliA [Anaeromassilibacillus sp. An200]